MNISIFNYKIVVDGDVQDWLVIRVITNSDELISLNTELNEVLQELH